MKHNVAARASSVILGVALVLFPALPGFASGEKPSPSSKEAAESICPQCHSKENVVPIVYGYPGKELMDDANAGKVKLGGCILRKDNPHWFCKKCGKSW